MDLYETSTNIIKEVFRNHEPFKNVFKRYTKDLSRYDQLEIARISSLFFRNYFLICHLSKLLNFPKESDEIIKLGLLYVNNAFTHKEDSNAMFTSFLTFIIQKGYVLSKNEITYIREVISKKRNYLFFDIKKGSIGYYSLRFNKPEWLIKLITKQYGRINGLRIVYEISSMPRQFVAVKYMKDFKPNSNYKKINSYFYEFLLDNSIRKEDAYHDGVIYSSQFATQLVLDEVEDYTNSNLTCFIGDEDTICYDFLRKFADKNNKLSFVSSMEGENKLFSSINEYNFDYVKTFTSIEKDINDVIKEEQHFILYAPKSSNFEIFRKEPDYSLYFDSASFDQLIKNQKEGLVSLTKKLAFNGVLLYIVPTLNLNETAYVVKDFIEKNQDSYSLDLQRMYVPTKEENSILYFALIRRIK